MKPLTEVQTEIIEDIESAASFFAQHRQHCKGVRALAEKAGHDPVRVHNMLKSLKTYNKVEGLARMKAAFEKAGITSKMFEENEVIETGEQQPAVPTAAVALPSAPTVSQMSDEYDLEIEVYINILSSLRKLKDRKRQQHMLSCVKLFFGLNT